MKPYHEIVFGYRKRRLGVLIDALAAALACIHGPCVLLCPALVLLQEGGKAHRGLKPAANAVQDSALRLLRIGAAWCAGKAAAACMGVGGAAAVSLGAGLLLARCRMRALTGMRVQWRILRLQELNAQLRNAQAPQPGLEDTTGPFKRIREA